MSQTRATEEKSEFLGENIDAPLLLNISKDVSLLIDDAYLEHTRRVLGIDERPRVYDKVTLAVHPCFKNFCNELLASSKRIYQDTFDYFLADIIQNLLTTNNELAEQNLRLTAENEKLSSQLKPSTLPLKKLAASEYNAFEDFYTGFDDIVSEINKKVIAHLTSQTARCKKTVSEYLSQEHYIREMKSERRSDFIIKDVNKKLDSLMTKFQEYLLNIFTNFYLSESREFKSITLVLTKENIPIRELLGMKPLLKVKKDFNKNILPLIEKESTIKELFIIHTKQKNKFIDLQNQHSILQEEITKQKTSQCSATLFASPTKASDNAACSSVDKTPHSTFSA